MVLRTHQFTDGGKTESQLWRGYKCGTQDPPRHQLGPKIRNGTVVGHQKPAKSQIWNTGSQLWLKNMWLHSSHLRHSRKCITYLCKYFGHTYISKKSFLGYSCWPFQGLYVCEVLDIRIVLGLKANNWRGGFNNMLVKVSEAWPFCREGFFSGPFNIHRYERHLLFTTTETAQ